MTPHRSKLHRAKRIAMKISMEMKKLNTIFSGIMQLRSEGATLVVHSMLILMNLEDLEELT
jgi:hypothetical protein